MLNQKLAHMNQNCLAAKSNNVPIKFTFFLGAFGFMQGDAVTQDEVSRLFRIFSLLFIQVIKTKPNIN